MDSLAQCTVPHKGYFRPSSAPNTLTFTYVKTVGHTSNVRITLGTDNKYRVGNAKANNFDGVLTALRYKFPDAFHQIGQQGVARFK